MRRPPCPRPLPDRRLSSAARWPGWSAPGGCRRAWPAGSSRPRGRPSGPPRPAVAGAGGAAPRPDHGGARPAGPAAARERAATAGAGHPVVSRGPVRPGDRGAAWAFRSTSANRAAVPVARWRACPALARLRACAQGRWLRRTLQPHPQGGPALDPQLRRRQATPPGADRGLGQRRPQVAGPAARLQAAWRYPSRAASARSTGRVGANQVSRQPRGYGRHQKALGRIL